MRDCNLELEAYMHPLSLSCFLSEYFMTPTEMQLGHSLAQRKHVIEFIIVVYRADVVGEERA